MLVTVEDGLVPLSAVARIHGKSVHLLDGSIKRRPDYAQFDILSLCPAQPDTFIARIFPDAIYKTPVVAWAHVLVDDMQSFEPVTADGVLDGLDRLAWNSCIVLPSGQATRPIEWEYPTLDEAVAVIRAKGDEEKLWDDVGETPTEADEKALQQ